MRRPPVRLDNIDEVYAYYETHRQDVRLAKLSHALAGLGLKTKFSYDEGVQVTAAKELAAGRQLVVAAHHVSLKDPRAVAQLPRQSEAFASMLGTTFVAAKSGIFKYPVMRHLVDNLGAVPAFRSKDLQAMDAASEALRRPAGGALVRTAIAKINAGEHMAWFPGAERAQETPLVVPPLKDGIGSIVCGVTEVPQPRIIPVGICYLDSSTPYLHLGELSPEEEFTRKDDVLDWLRPSIQASVDTAHELVEAAHHRALGH